MALTAIQAQGIGDPQFVGFRGQSFQIHGIDGQVYNIVSDAQLQMNSKFIFLSEGKCPDQSIMKSLFSKQCWTHPGSYLADLSIQTSDGNKLFIQSGPNTIGFTQVTINDKLMTVGSSHPSSSLNVTMLSSHSVTARVGLFSFVIENSDYFVNIAQAVIHDWDLMITQIQSHGILGQTWRKNPLHPGVEVKALEGSVDDYAVYENSAWGTDFVYNKFALTK